MAIPAEQIFCYTVRMAKECTLSSEELQSEKLDARLAAFGRSGITEFVLHDRAVLSDKKLLLRFLQAAARNAPQCFFTFSVEPAVLDVRIIAAIAGLFASVNVAMRGSVRVNERGAPFLLLDKRLFARKARLLNDAGAVFGFELGLARQSGDSFRAFAERLDFALSLYPNHLHIDCDPPPEPTGTFSTQEIRKAAEIAHACRSFYNAGRAVPWFLALLEPLRIRPSRFLADFAEWQRCNNCGIGSGFDADSAAHKDIEVMQLHFLRMKYEERRLERLLAVAEDTVRLHGAFARASGEGEETRLSLSYLPEDLLSPAALHPAGFCEDVCMVQCGARVFLGSDGPECECAP